MAEGYFIERMLAEAIKKAPRDKAHVLSGARQVGKTTLLERLFSGPKVRRLSDDEPGDVSLLAALSSAEEAFVLEKVLDPYVEDAALIVPGNDGLSEDNDLRERVSGADKRLGFLLRFFCGVHIEG